MIVIDSSALLAVIFEEADAMAFASALVSANRNLLAAPTYVEAHQVAFGRYAREGSVLLDELLRRTGIAVVEFDLEQGRSAAEAFRRYGRGSGHPAQLNLGDTFSYALAKTRGLPLLFKGNDFRHTDITPAMRPD